jgi:epoxyqueuosine reductase QueG
MITPENIKKRALELGADKCGIASADSFVEAPKGFHPRDIFSLCKSVVVFIKQMPIDAIFAENPIPYTHTAYKMYEEMDRIAMEMCRYMQKNGAKAVIVPSDVPYMHWDAENMYGHGILSLKHAAVLAGLGIMGKSTILINQDLGNMTYIGAALTDRDLPPDSAVKDFSCPPRCRKCIDVCPGQAMDGVTVNQKRCRERSFFKTGRGWDLYNCSECRKVCPYRLGTRGTK